MIPPTVLRLVPNFERVGSKRMTCKDCGSYITARTIAHAGKSYLWFGCEPCNRGSTYIADPAPARPPERSHR